LLTTRPRDPTVNVVVVVVVVVRDGFYSAVRGAVSERWGEKTEVDLAPWVFESMTLELFSSIFRVNIYYIQLK
jgi:hypothetical protein